ncbi:MAG: ATP-binding protein, partial [Acidobacteria bacterium]|nr:ATP-binding protein [Acidobacteriota bacterium]
MSSPALPKTETGGLSPDSNMNSAFSEVWSTFCAELDSRNRRLQEEFAECWGQIHPLLEGLARDFNLEHWQQPERGRLPSLDMLVETAGKVLLFDPIRVLKKAHPLQRALGAIEAYDSAMEDLLRVLPQQGMVSGRELSEVMRERGIRSWRHAWLRWRREPQPRRLRLAARRRILQDALEQSRYQGQVMLVMAKASLALLVPWQLVRQETLRTLHGAEPELQALEKERRVWLGLIQSLQARASAVFPRYEARASRASARVSASLLRMQAEHSDKGEALMRDRRQKCFGFWSRQQRAVGSLLELELTMARLLTEAGRTSRESLRSLHEEHAQLRKEMDDVISWLEAQRSAVADTPFPPPEARLSSAEDRTGEWLRSLSARAKASLPAHVESIIPRRALPGRKPPGRQLEPEGLFTGVLERTGRRRAAAGFREAEAGHRAVVREIERAREVAAFSLEAAAEGDQEGLQVARDGIANALELVKHQRQGTRDYQQITEQGLAEGLAAGFYEFHLALEEGRIGFLAHLARQRGSQLLLTGSKLAMSRTRAAAGQSQKLITRGYNRLLVQAGWSPPSVTAAEPVTRREYLGELLRLQAVPRVLPPIYRRLFRLAPVEDARFLVGREAEMSALTEARGHWESGRSVSVVIVGARGSGKTSLLKCASSSVFADLEVLYGQFCERLTTEEGIVGFLADLLQTGPDKLG